MKAEVAQDLAPELDTETIRPIAPEVLEILDRGRKIAELVGVIRDAISEVIDSLVTRFPDHRKQIADVLEGAAQQQLKSLYDEHQKARRHGSR